MDGQQVCAQMALLGDEDKERRDSEFGKVALPPSPTVAGLPPRHPPAARSLSSAPPTFVRRKATTG